MAQARVTRGNVLVLGSVGGIVKPKDLRSLYPQFLRNDWSTPVKFTTHWLTDIAYSYDTLREEAVALKNRATHTIEATTLGWDQGESFSHYIGAIRAAQNDFPIPLYCDRARLTAATSGFFVPCDPMYRRFYVGQRVALVKQDFQKVDITSVQAYAEYGLITSISSQGITLQEEIIVDWQEGDWIYPMLDCHPIVTTDGTLHSDYHLSTNIIATEEGGSSALPPTFRNRIGHLWNYDDQIPVVNFEAWDAQPELSIVAQGGIRDLGKGSTANIQGKLPQIQWTFTTLMDTRKKAWELLNLFDSCKGRGKQLHVLDPLSSFSVQGYSSNYIDIDPIDNIDSWNQGWIEHIGLEFDKRRRVVRKVTSAQEINDGATFRIFFDAPYTNSDPLTRATIGHRCRFAEDSLTIEWLTDEISRCTFSVMTTQASEGINYIINMPSAYTIVGQ